MFVVYPHPILISATSPEEAAKKAHEQRSDLSCCTVRDTETGDLHVIQRTPDWDPTGPRKEFEQITHLSQRGRNAVVEEMMYQAHCADRVLRKICQSASMSMFYEDFHTWEASHETEP